MNSTASTVIVMIVVCVIVVIPPLITMTARVDNVTQQNVQAIVDEFVLEIVNTGRITKNMYKNFDNKLNTNGNVLYEIDIEIHVLDENPGKKTAQTNYTKIGENVYLIYYTTQILPAIGIKVDNQDVSSTEQMLLPAGSKVFVKATSEDPTANQTLTSSMLGFSNAGENAITASASGMVTVEGGAE